jgi:hypothetical protein
MGGSTTVTEMHEVPHLSNHKGRLWCRADVQYKSVKLHRSSVRSHAVRRSDI